MGSSTGAVSHPEAWKKNVVNNLAVNYENGGLTQGDIHAEDIGITQEAGATVGQLQILSWSYLFPAMGLMNI